MSLPYINSKVISLRQAGYDELWLQNLIHKEPFRLGLGDLKSLFREVRQSSRGRLDLLMTDPESEVIYEVELMLGATDESHIIRTIDFGGVAVTSGTPSGSSTPVDVTSLCAEQCVFGFPIQNSDKSAQLLLPTIHIPSQIDLELDQSQALCGAHAGGESPQIESSVRRMVHVVSGPRNVYQATPAKRTGKSMSRRTSQNGHIEESGKWWVVRWWMDVPGQEKRTHKRARICPIAGPGSLSKSTRVRRAREIIAESGADSEEHFNKIVKQQSGVTFKEQAVCWLFGVKARKRKPVANATIESWEGGIE